LTIPTTPPSCSCKPRATLGCEAACATGAKGRHDGTTRRHAKGAYTRAKSSSCTHDSNRRINKSSFHFIHPSLFLVSFIHSFIHSLTHWLCDRRNDRCIHMSNRSTQLSNWLQYLLSYVSTYPPSLNDDDTLNSFDLAVQLRSFLIGPSNAYACACR
jgi:hypothetical protein